ncbi:unnamed protein product [Caenorhabditis angaria]|uniref:Uncharacterized protein n=1 Tax=Caenorhabditis angaria TaxID=860376 RepID=A0A9P1IL60_9PELO|nr:unnamed protein product [Caenorhabditis angaria]
MIKHLIFLYTILSIIAAQKTLNELWENCKISVNKTNSCISGDIHISISNNDKTKHENSHEKIEKIQCTRKNPICAISFETITFSKDRKLKTFSFGCFPSIILEYCQSRNELKEHRILCGSDLHEQLWDVRENECKLHDEIKFLKSTNISFKLTKKSGLLMQFMVNRTRANSLASIKKDEEDQFHHDGILMILGVIAILKISYMFWKSNRRLLRREIAHVTRIDIQPKAETPLKPLKESEMIPRISK